MRSVAIVTGAGSGIGREIALALARRGERVFGVALGEDELARLRDDVARAGGVCDTLAVDLTAAGSPAAVVDAVRARGLEIATLVSSAGVGLFGDHLSLDPAAVSRMLALNVAALTELTTRCADEMVARGQGRILSIASTAAFQPLPRLAAYAATKHYVTAFSLALAEELRDRGVRVSVLCPGTTRTPFIQGAGIEARTRVGRLADRVAMRPEEVAAYALHALDSGAPLVVAGALNRTHRAVARAVPPEVLSRLFARATAP